MSKIFVEREFVETYPVKWEPLKQDDIDKIFTKKSFEKLKEISLYVHMPFCPFVCEFCYFGKMLFNKSLYEKYIEALKKEIIMFKGHPDFRNRKITAIYVGGGTGSILTPRHAKELFELFREIFPLNNEVEITIESHPLTLNHDKLLEYKKQGVNRICIGIQSFDRRNLKSIDRENHHHINEKIIQTCKEIGFEKVGIDLIYRFPKQTITNLIKDLEKCIETSPDQISVYSLEVRGTLLETILSEMPSDDVDKEMFYRIKGLLEDYDYIHFEQCDFAKPGKYSRYSSNVWKTPQQITLGFGAAAYSDYFGNYSWTNLYPVEKYIDIVNKGFFPGVLGIEITKEELMARYMVLGSRCMDIDKKLFYNLFDVKIDEYFANQLEKLMDYGWIEDSNNKYVITKDGIYYINNISKEFYTKPNQREKQPKHKNLYNFVPKSFHKKYFNKRK